MTDIAIVWVNGRGNIQQAGIDMLTDDSLTTEVIISLFTDRRALDSDDLPGGDSDRRGGGATATAIGLSVPGCGCCLARRCNRY